MFSLNRSVGLLIVIGALSSTAKAEIQLLARYVIPGSESDNSQLQDVLPTGEPHSRLGGFSAIDYLGENRYLVLSDRGPGDGAAKFRCRWHLLEIPLTTAPVASHEVKVLETTLLWDPQNRPFTGFSADIPGLPAAKGVRLDPEGVRWFNERIFISDEYGPLLLEFTAEGRQTAQFPVPDRFTIKHSSAFPDQENDRNRFGRQSNRGPEGLAITPDGRTLVAAMQGPLLQDSERTSDGKRRGKFVRILAMDLAKKNVHEYVYPLDDTNNGISEILAINQREFLVLERDSSVGKDAHFKKITHIDLAGATNIRGVESLPAQILPESIQPIQKSVWLDFLDPRFHLAGPHFPEKIEGLTFGPRLSDGRLTLIATVDNDFEPEFPSEIYCFACTPDELPGFSWKR